MSFIHLDPKSTAIALSFVLSLPVAVSMMGHFLLEVAKGWKR
ncbi:MULTISPECIES: hypothetical protein [unclassified Paenibacillus]|nr:MULTISPECIES: hypothetical protein [unclassified Paenibacillus]MEE4565934.1 hypothetical protein [Paenibacillus polymyxa]